jgi:cytochrome bd ubiquinol oxidase subunit I
MTLDPLILSRIQFVWVIGWHILLPAFTIGLASFIAAMEGAHIITGREILFRISSFWIKIFSVAFGMGVVSGIVMPFQFGTNWSRYSEVTANVDSIKRHLPTPFTHRTRCMVLRGGPTS